MHLDRLIILDDGQVSLSLDIIDCATFALDIHAAEYEAHFVLKCPLYNPIKDKSSTFLENVVLGKSQVLPSIGPTS